MVAVVYVASSENIYVFFCQIHPMFFCLGFFINLYICWDLVIMLVWLIMPVYTVSGPSVDHMLPRDFINRSRLGFGWRECIVILKYVLYSYRIYYFVKTIERNMRNTYCKYRISIMFISCLKTIERNMRNTYCKYRIPIMFISCLRH